ncbi:MAG: 4-hydroxybenzoate octaprenyltransferase [Zetaproteobacteria bacterium CG06_land_8_20_14_3_00_59_53]|nr:MAG: 4-hydroxybenzoate polyprenyltransferase [Zetaproteobacteria bacterium CG2_30_59_37]PIO89603.1 MAG: 4-hydroxybenzoate octaprenyltransferase [Zetaproteobacteria bacterium CG23_combo_of_CG06-09_8_20_14_all_59_86]PIQ65835.1 MAG: 4-hydroxybenzoate octaprenyltransferase [Zetaproteobacteria bacterium CG11_big_fil_rev_8_21_14_0_20_59_439]PIU70987.1 MAG: 4-hydroxybenzoate octaprenyltransferase [Zetaproteobacteria bacterium CG06_land_8_20_14_3_00_59_53]PIU97140.1 MAG: 4-hydroxybenzoate octaprenyl
MPVGYFEVISRRMHIYLRLMRADRPIGTYLVAWPMLWALWFAGNGHPDAGLVLIFLAGAFLMRSAGCVINDFADRNIDPHVERTRARPLAAGEISSKEALGLFVVLCLTAFALVLCTNRLTVYLSVGGVALAALYPFMKRYTQWPQVFLGAAFGWAVPMAFAAQSGEVPAASWLIFAANVCWVVAYDTMYAMVDRDDDVKIGVKSTAILFGHWDRHIIGLFQLGFFALMIAAGRVFDASLLYYAGLGVAAGFAIYHQRLIFTRQREACFRAFLNNNLLGGAVFAGLALSYLFT